MTKPRIKQTTVRLPEELHSRLRRAAEHLNITSEEIIKLSLEQELERLGFGKDVLPTRTLVEPIDWSPQLAARFLQCVPAPFAIKDDQARIIWCNFAYQDALEMTMPQLVGKTILEVSSIDSKWNKVIEKNIETVLGDGKAIEFVEPIVSKKGKTTIYQGHRFLFHNSKGNKFLGDISFDWTEIQVLGEHQAISPDLLTRFQGTYISAQVEELFLPFLENCSASVVIKDKDLKIVWDNEIYRRLVNTNSKADREPRGKTLKELVPNALDLALIMEHDSQILKENVWMYTKEQLQRGNPRTTLRFPIPVAGDNQFIGAISTDFQLKSSIEAAIPQPLPHAKSAKI
jgi:PAS domain-containing protein